jgi:hypothetical protein
MDVLQFEVGSRYENEKGVYEVLSIDKTEDMMVIQWESGKEIPTQMSFQRQILERRQILKDLAETKKKSGRPKRAKNRSGSGVAFDGFKESDFSEKVKGTTWRTKKALGGAVAALFETDGLQFNSWAVTRMPMIHWQDIGHHALEDQGLQAKLFARLDESNLYYGFYIERSNEKSQSEIKEDWSGFLEWLQIPENESWLREAMEKNQLCVYDQYGGDRPFAGKISVVDGNWNLVDGNEKEDISSLAGFLEQLPRTHALDLQIAKIVGKEDVLSRGGKVAEDIAGIFEILMPLYTAAITDK